MGGITQTLRPSKPSGGFNALLNIVIEGLKIVIEFVMG
jgi:hypothetical protein